VISIAQPALDPRCLPFFTAFLTPVLDERNEPANPAYFILRLWSFMAFQRKKPAAIGTKASYPGFIEPALASSAERVRRAGAAQPPHNFVNSLELCPAMASGG